jgi:hypothetical protein
MGVTIHYRGKLDNTDDLPGLCEKLISIANSLGWEYQTLDDDWSFPADAVLEHRGNSVEIKGNLGLKGVQLTPPGESESISFFFDSNGHLLSPISVILVLEGRLALENVWISVKTQFVSADTHVMIVGILKYVKERHIPNLEVHDEGEYWETGDYRLLEAKMEFIREKIDYLTRGLASEDSGKAGRSEDEIAARIERLFHAANMDSKLIH